MPDAWIYTIGHSTQPIERLVELLQKHDIDCVIDVRSTPYSRRVPHFNREALRAWLRRAKIRYAHMPAEFGARHSDPDLLDEEGRVDFDRVRASAPFQRGVQRLRDGVEKGFRIVLMCAEADPFDCHRFSMIAYQLAKEGIGVKHILRNGELLDNEALERRLVEHAGLALVQPDIFGSSPPDRPVLDEAYRKRGREIAYHVINRR